MKKILPVLAFCFFVYQSAQAQNKPIDVYLIAGQSNATGQGYMRNLVDSMHFDTTTTLIFNSGRPHLNSGKPAYTWQGLHQASESADRFGPELGFASKMQRLYSGKTIALIKHAHTGTNLYADWNPGKDEKDTKNWGLQFREFVMTVNAGMEGLRSQGYKPVIRGILWQQGESDAAKDSSATVYAQNLTHFIERVRQQFHVKNMPFVYGYVLPPPNAGSGRDIVRKAQHDIDEHSGSSLAVKHAYIVATDDLQQRSDDKNSPLPNDHVHLGTNGIWVLGVRMADKMALVQ